MTNSPPPERRRHPLERTPEEYAALEAQRTPRPSVALRVARGRPYVTYALIAFNLLIFAAGALLDGLDERLLDWGAVSHDAVLCEQYYADFEGGCVPRSAMFTRSFPPRPVAEGGELYRLFSAIFLHVNILHIFFNMYALYAFGTFIEWIYGHGRYALLYLLGGLSGSLLSALFGESFSRSVGASGAIFAIFGANIVFLYRQRAVLGTAGRSQLTQLLVLAGMNLVLGFTPGSGVDNWGHIGGMVGGFVLAWLVNPTLLPVGERTLPDGHKVQVVNSIGYAPRSYVLFLLYAAVWGAVLFGALWLNLRV